MIESEKDLPEDVSSLKLLALDLSRRLQNAQHTIDAERRIAQTALQQAEYYRNRLAETIQSFRMESSRIRQAESKIKFDEEAKKFEDNKAKGTTLHDQLRLMELDYQMTGFQKFVPLKLVRLRQKVKQLETQQESQKLLLQQYSELYQINEEFITSVQQNDITQAMLLLQAGADVNHMDHAGYLAIHYACSQGSYDVVQCLLDHGSDFTSYLTGHSPLVIAAKHGHLNIIKLLLQHGVNVEEKGVSGCPALIAALESQQISTVEYLVQSGANVNAIDMHENTALHLATRLPKEHLHIIDFLISMGANVEMVNKKVQTAAQMAFYEKHKVAAYLVTGQPLDFEDDTPEENNQPSTQPGVGRTTARSLAHSRSAPAATASKKVNSIKAIKHLHNHNHNIINNTMNHQATPVDGQMALQQHQMQQHQHQYAQQLRPTIEHAQLQQMAEDEIGAEMLLGGDNHMMDLVAGGALDGGPSVLSSLPFTAASHSLNSSVTFD